MKKNVIALLLTLILAVGSIGTVPTLAAETSVPTESTEESEVGATLASEEVAKEQIPDAGQLTEEDSTSETDHVLEEDLKEDLEQALDEESEEEQEELSDENGEQQEEALVETEERNEETKDVEETEEVVEEIETDIPETPEFSEATLEETYLPIVVDAGAIEESGKSAAYGSAIWDAEKLSSLPILGTDVSEASDGCVLLGLPGEYIASQQAVLDMINEIRKEACDEGVMNPETNQPLTPDDYVPLKWSHELEGIARIRAAETSMTADHKRANGDSWQSMESEYWYVGECVAWNYSKSATKGIEQWYDEKKYWLDGNSDDSGHYTTLIRPSMRHVGGGTFYTRNAQYPNTTLVEFYTEEGLDDSFIDMTGECIQMIEVSEANLNGNPSVIGTFSGVKNDEHPLFLTTNVKYTGYFTANTSDLLFLDGVNWSSSDNSIVSVSTDGVAKAAGCGSARITAQAYNGVSAASEFTVNHVFETIPAVEATCTEIGLTEGEKCVNCGAITTEQEIIPATGHKWEEKYTVDKPATYTEEGSESIHCEYCGAIKEGSSRTIAKLKKPVSGLTISGISNKTYNGKAQTQAVVVKDGSTTLKNGTDYTVAYKNNTNAGTASVVITGEGIYSGSVTKNFAINKAANAITAKNFTKTYSKKAQYFNIGAKATGGTLTYTSNKKKVKVNKAGKVTIKAKFIGKATITITAQNANYKKVVKKITVTVNPTKTVFSSVKNNVNNKITVKWKRNIVGTGYQIQYGTSKTFARAKTVTISRNSATTKVIGIFKKHKTIYVRIRTYKKIGKVKFYSAWSNKKKVHIKK